MDFCSLRSKILRLEWSVFVQLLKSETWDVTFDSSCLLCCPGAWIHEKEENMGQTLRRTNIWGAEEESSKGEEKQKWEEN